MVTLSRDIYPVTPKILQRSYTSRPHLNQKYGEGRLTMDHDQDSDWLVHIHFQPHSYFTAST